jgi:hypothetical protein
VSSWLLQSLLSKRVNLYRVRIGDGGARAGGGGGGGGALPRDRGERQARGLDAETYLRRRGVRGVHTDAAGRSGGAGKVGAALHNVIYGILQSKHIRLMTASVVHVSNLTTPGSDNPSRAYGQNTCVDDSQSV